MAASSYATQRHDTPLPLYISPLLISYIEHPTAWELEARGPSDADADDEDSSSDGEEDVVAPKPIARKVHTEQKLVHSHAYDEFRQFLELGCMGSPVEAYPAIIIVLSTISPQARPLHHIICNLS